MSIIVHRAQFDDALAALRSESSVLISAPPGLGKTRFATDLTRAFCAESDATVTRFTAPASAPTPLFAPFAGLPIDAPVYEVVQALIERIGTGVLLVDDAHRLTTSDEQVIDILLRAPQSRIVAVLTMTDVAGRVPRIRRLRYDALLTEIRLNELTLDGTTALAQSIVAPGRFDVDTLRHVRASCGGVPLLIAEFCRMLRANHSVVTRDGVVMWDGTDVNRGDVAELAHALTIDLSPEALEAATVTSLAGPLLFASLLRIVGDDAAEELLDSGLVTRSGNGPEARVRMAHAFAARAIKRVSTATQRLDLAPRVFSALDVENRAPAQWQTAELRATIRFALQVEHQLPFALIRTAWLGARGEHDQQLMADIASAVIAHPDAIHDEKLRAHADRIDALRATSQPEAALAALPAADALVEGASLRVRAQYACTKARALQHISQADELAQRVLANESAHAALYTSADAEWASSTLEVEAASLLAYSGNLRDAFPALQRLIVRSKTQARNIPAIGGYLMIAAQAGANREAQRLALRYFPLALLRAKAYPWGPHEMVIGGFFLDMAVGRIGSARRTAKKVDSALASRADSLSPYDAASGQVGWAFLHAADGSWAEAAVEYEASLTRLASGDGNGLRAFIYANAAVAYGALGDEDAAWSSMSDARQYLSGVSRIAIPWVRVQLLLAELWLGRDISAPALEVAADAQSHGMHLVELRALHLAALSLGSHMPHAAVVRARELANLSDAPITAPLVEHISELAAGSARLGGPGARNLARHGLIVPLRGTLSELTQRERQVAHAAALGYSSKSIALQLGNSKRTIDAHLNRIYVKLGVTGREDLADALDADRS